MNKDSNTKERTGLEELIESFTLERLKSLEPEVRKTKQYEVIQAREAQAYRQLEEALPKETHTDLSRFAHLWVEMTHYHYYYCYSRSFGDAVLFISRILGLSKGDVLSKLMEQQAAHSNPMSKSLDSHHGLSSISEDEDFSTGGNVPNRETNFWQFIKDCMDERLCLIGSEGLNETKYVELHKEIRELALRLKDALPEDKKGLVVEYNDLLAEEESGAEDIFYPQGFVDAARMLWG